MSKREGDCMKIIYIHHGQRLKGNPSSQNDGLTELGLKDCYLTADLLNDNKIKENIKAIYTSPFYRCKKTAEIVNTNLGVDIIDDDRLNEFGSIDGESWSECQERLLLCLNDIENKYNDDDIVICVTSGVNICAFIIKAFGLSVSLENPFLIVPSCSPIMFDYKKRK